MNALHTMVAQHLEHPLPSLTELHALLDEEMAGTSREAAAAPMVEAFISAQLEKRSAHHVAAGTHACCRNCGCVRLIDHLIQARSQRFFCSRDCFAAYAS